MNINIRKELRLACEKMDWYFSDSEDHSVWRRGSDAVNHLIGLVNQFGHINEGLSILLEYCPVHHIGNYVDMCTTHKRFTILNYY